MELLIALLVGANTVMIILINERLKKVEDKKDPYEKYRTHDGLLKRNPKKESVGK